MHSSPGSPVRSGQASVLASPAAAPTESRASAVSPANRLSGSPSTPPPARPGSCGAQAPTAPGPTRCSGRPRRSVTTLWSRSTPGPPASPVGCGARVGPASLPRPGSRTLEEGLEEGETRETSSPPRPGTSHIARPCRPAGAGRPRARPRGLTTGTHFQPHSPPSPRGPRPRPRPGRRWLPAGAWAGGRPPGASTRPAGRAWLSLAGGLGSRGCAGRAVASPGGSTRAARSGAGVGRSVTLPSVSATLTCVLSAGSTPAGTSGRTSGRTENSERAPL